MNQELIVLASASPRRRELLRQINVEHEVRPANVDETRLSGETPDEFTRRVALSKAERVLDELDGADGRIVLAADTAVVLADEIFGKPADAIGAAAMLRRLSGRVHEVVTAVAGARGAARRPREGELPTPNGPGWSPSLGVDAAAGPPVSSPCLIRPR